jgi:hypothetical protein
MRQRDLGEWIQGKEDELCFYETKITTEGFLG